MVVLDFSSFETADGYQFKSIDKLFDQPQKKSFVFNNSTEAKDGIPAGYDGKILDHQSDSSINVQSKMNIGAYKLNWLCLILTIVSMLLMKKLLMKL